METPKKVNDSLAAAQWQAGSTEGWPVGNHDPSKIGVICDGDGNWCLTFNGDKVGTPLATE